MPESMRPRILSAIKRIIIVVLLMIGSLAFLDMGSHWIKIVTGKLIYFTLSALFLSAALGLSLFATRAAYVFTSIVCSLYIIFFMVILGIILAIDKTGKGLVGLVFLMPQFVIAFVVALFSHFECKKIKKASVS